MVAKSLLEDDSKGLVRLGEHRAAAIGELDADDPAVLARRLAEDEAVLLQPIGDAGRSARAAHKLGRDLAHLELAVGRDLQTHKQLELGPGEIGGRSQPLLDLGLDDARGLGQVDPGPDLIPVRSEGLHLHIAHAIWNSLMVQSCSFYSCSSKYCKEKNYGDGGCGVCQTGVRSNARGAGG